MYGRRFEPAHLHKKREPILAPFSCGDISPPSQHTLTAPDGGICRPFVSLRSGAIAASICYADLADASGTVLMHLFVADVLSGVYIYCCAKWVSTAMICNLLIIRCLTF